MKTKHQLLMIMFTIVAKNAFAQVAMLSPFVISASGGFFTSPSNYTYSATVAEMTMIETWHANTYLTQGFQQPVPDHVVGIGESANAGLEINIFPNPATNLLSVIIHSYNNSQYRLKIRDIIGQEMSSYNYVPNVMGTAFKIDIGRFAPGIYLITIESTDKTFRKTTRFIKN